MKKINEKIANKLGEKFKEITEIVTIEDKYIPILNYDQFELESFEKNLLISFEEKAIHHVKELSKNTIALSKIFYEAQTTLASAGSGSFVKWYEGLGFKKDFVYMLLKRNELFLKIDDEKIFEIPEKAIKTISKIKDKVEVKDILNIVNAEKPLIMAKEVENSLSGNPKDYLPESINKKMLEKRLEEIKKIEKEITEYYKKIKKLERDLETLKSGF
ncbi:MAG: hypothetical protein ACRDAQ_10110 [Cetobacterium sp.]